MSRLRKILLPVDIGESSSPALDAARSLAAAEGASILLFHVVPTDELHLLRREYRVEESGGADESTARRAAEQDLHRTAKTLRESGIRADVLVVSGKPSERIVELARDEAVDLVVLAKRRGGSRLREWVLGSTTYQVVRRLERNVLVVR
jgi:nucleotide-binding universal stress UspA family protein